MTLEQVPLGPHFFSIADLRAFEGGGLADEDAYPDEVLERKRAAAETVMERACAVAFVPRETTTLVTGSGTTKLMLPTVELRSVSACSIDGVDLSADELAALKVRPWGHLQRETPWPEGSDVIVTYSHGYDAPDAPVVEATLILAYETSIPRAISRRATAQSSGDTTWRLTIAGRDGRTGIPDVDAVIVDYRRSTWSVS